MGLFLEHPIKDVGEMGRRRWSRFRAFAHLQKVHLVHTLS